MRLRWYSVAHNNHRKATALPDADTLRQLYYIDGATVRQIAKQFCCRTSAVLRAMDDAGIKRRRTGRTRAPLPAWDSEKLWRLVKVKGMPYVREFAREHGVNQVKLAALLGDSALARGQRRQQVLLDHDEAIRIAYNEGTPIKVLAEQYGCSRRAIGYSLDRTSRKQSAGKTTSAILPADCFPF